MLGLPLALSVWSLAKSIPSAENLYQIYHVPPILILSPLKFYPSIWVWNLKIGYTGPPNHLIQWENYRKMLTNDGICLAAFL